MNQRPRQVFFRQIKILNMVYMGLGTPEQIHDLAMPSQPFEDRAQHHTRVGVKEQDTRAGGDVAVGEELGDAIGADGTAFHQARLDKEGLHDIGPVACHGSDAHHVFMRLFLGPFLFGKRRFLIPGVRIQSQGLDDRVPRSPAFLELLNLHHRHALRRVGVGKIPIIRGSAIVLPYARRPSASSEFVAVHVPHGQVFVQLVGAWQGDEAIGVDLQDTSIRYTNQPT